MGVSGHQLHWMEAGEGPPIVLLHGIFDSHRTWLELAPALARERRVLMLDLPGQGLSARPDENYALHWYAQLVGTWMAGSRRSRPSLYLRQAFMRAGTRVGMRLLAPAAYDDHQIRPAGVGAPIFFSRHLRGCREIVI
jgi:hypothetical protein